MNPINNNIIVTIVEVQPLTKSSIVNVDGNPMNDAAQYHNHPYQLKVEYAPVTVTSNGNEFPSSVKEGDIVLVSVNTIKQLQNEERFIVWQGKEMFTIRHSEVIAVV